MLALSGRSGARLGALLAITCTGLTAAACGSSSSSSAPPSAKPSASDSARASGPASVAYAASLAYLNEKVIAPAFEKSTGLSYTGLAGPSDGLEAKIASGEITPNVFEAVGGDNITPLFPRFTKWYIHYAETSLVLAYNPNSKYASQFEAIASGKEPIKNLFTLMEQPGFKLGRTDPNTDPQGRAFIYMLELARAKYSLPADTVSKILGGVAAGSANSPQIFDEATLPARLQAGRLDAASAYAAQAAQLRLRYISLPAGINLGDGALAKRYSKASITITGNVTKHGSPLGIDITTIGSKDQAAADAFVSFVLSPGGLALHKQAGYALVTPTAYGSAAAIPKSISAELGSS
ncbi:MAG TPA: substrate-binding domain-containing protein [Streptosporangiaceae bacterium]|nr:substrate-binding domain-containing protein [Streptosporangiaceae bacterium]